MNGYQRIRLAAVLVLTGLLLSLPGARVLAAPPANDNFENATVIGSFPFTDGPVDLSEASREPLEPAGCDSAPETVWYTFTASATAVIETDLTGSNLAFPAITVYRSDGPGFSGLTFVACARSEGHSQSFQVEAGITYYVQAGRSVIFDGGGTILQIKLEAVAPPPNDDFADALAVPSLPFSHPANTGGATVESGEPLPSCASFDKLSGGSAWYVFTPSTTGSISARSEFHDSFVAAYTGNSLSSLSEVACRAFGGNATFLAQAGTAYYFQTGGLAHNRQNLQFRLEVAPPPVVEISLFPADPSIFETVQFFGFSHDPAGIGIQTESWDLGDGTTAEGCCPTHQYAADGDYTVQLTVTTFDGRSASTSQVVPVRTHDVAITKFSVPKAASAGQTRGIVVGINSRRYPETVQVNLYKSLPGGFEHVGSLTQFVPVRPSNRTTDFKFSYTFSPADAAIGKVTFKATAHILGARDALPADNEAIAPPTKVSP